jgi:hypothetical protein
MRPFVSALRVYSKWRVGGTQTWHVMVMGLHMVPNMPSLDSRRKQRSHMLSAKQGIPFEKRSFWPYTANVSLAVENRHESQDKK